MARHSRNSAAACRHDGSGGIRAAATRATTSRAAMAGKNHDNPASLEADASSAAAASAGAAGPAPRTTRNLLADVQALDRVVRRSATHGAAAAAAAPTRGRGRGPARGRRGRGNRDRGNDLHDDGEGGADAGAEPKTPTIDDVARAAVGHFGADAKSAAAVARGGCVGWDADSLVSSALRLSADNITAVAAGTGGGDGDGKGWANGGDGGARGGDGRAKAGGVVGAVRYRPGTGVHHFCVAVKDPVDDAFWVGVCYPEAPGWFADTPAKANPHCVVWSGGAAGHGPGRRPGTVRLHGEKFREQPQYGSRDRIGVVVDTDTGDISFWRGGRKVLDFSGAVAGKVCAPFFSCSASVAGPSATLVQWPLDRTYGSSGDGAVPAAATDGATAHMSGTVAVDGSLLEGGGQVIRVALAASALTRTPIHMVRIRARRSKPGLGHQHATGARLVAQGCGAAIDPEALLFGAHLEGVTEMRVWPGVRGVTGGRFVADTHTAGAVTLLLQAGLPTFLLGQPTEPVQLVLRGGTNVRGAPSVEYFAQVLVPLLERMGVPPGAISAHVAARGFYPRGGGELVVDIAPACQLAPLTIVDRGDIAAVRGTVVASARARKDAKAAAAALRRAVCDRFSGEITPEQVTVDICFDDGPPKPAAVAATWPPGGAGGAAAAAAAGAAAADRRAPTLKERRQLADERAAMTDAAMQCQLVLTTTTGAVMAADCLVETAKNRAVIDPDDVAATAAERLVDAWRAGGCVDEHTMDQLIVFMALAHGRSEILCNAETSISSLHLSTAVHFVTLLTGAAFEIDVVPETGARRVVCQGVGWVNE